MNTEIDMNEQARDKPHGIWECKIGEAGVLGQSGLDLPMREAVAAAYREITGEDPDFIFSGWRGSLTEGERAVVEDRLPDENKVTVEVSRKRLADLEDSEKLLLALQNAGVDNWSGYDYAMEEYRS